MKASELLELTRAGFSKDEILAIINADSPAKGTTSNLPPEENTAAEPIAAAEPAPASEEKAPAQPAGADIMTQIMAKMDERFNELAESLKQPLFPSMGEIKPLGIDDIIRDFFKED